MQYLRIQDVVNYLDSHGSIYSNHLNVYSTPNCLLLNIFVSTFVMDTKTIVFGDLHLW